MLCLLLVVVMASAYAQRAESAQQNQTAYTFSETGKTVSGELLLYWKAHGGVAQIGFPISEQVQEKSATDGKTYSVQYFERAVLELHPENQPPYNVLASLLGVSLYRQKYPQGAPGQVPDNQPGSIAFSQTGKRLGGGFLAFWNQTGGLMQHGYPISDEFTEVSDLDHKPYTVQYFERAVFEWHPENRPPYSVLLSQLGTYRYRAAHGQASAQLAPAPKHPYGIVAQGGLGEPIDPSLLKAQYGAGIRLWLVHLGWNVLQPGGSSDWNGQAASDFQHRIDTFVALGSDARLALDLGIQYPPGWVAQTDPLVDQFGNRWQASPANGGAPNVYWSPTVRQYVAGYLEKIFHRLDFHGRLWVVRVGPSGGELLYPNRANGDQGLSFWAFDQYAQSKSPVPGWRPGQDSPNGEAARFYDWYVDNLVDTFNFYLGEIRHYYSGYVAPVTPGMGMNNRTAGQLISRNLVDNSLTTYGTGNYWKRLFAEFPGNDRGVLNWCSSVGDGSGNDGSPDETQWSSARIQAHLAHSADRQIYGESPGQNPFDTSGGADPRTTAQWIFKAAHDFGYLGVLWVSQADMSDPKNTSLDQLRRLITQYP